MPISWPSVFSLSRWRVPAQQRKLEKLAFYAADPVQREQAAEELSHPWLVRRVARHGGDPDVRRLACRKLDSVEDLFRCLIRDPDPRVRWMAVDRLYALGAEERLAGLIEKHGAKVRDEALLASLVFELPLLDGEAWRSARDRGEDAVALSLRANDRLERAAVARLEQPEWLAYLACHHRNPVVRTRARERYPSDGEPLEAVAAETYPYGCPTCQYVSSDPMVLRVCGCSKPAFSFAQVTCPRCGRDYEVTPAPEGGGTQWMQNLSNGPLWWDIGDCPECGGVRTHYRVEFPRAEEKNCRRCGWSESSPLA